MGLRDVTGVFSRFFVVGFFLPSFFVVFALAALFERAEAVYVIGGTALLAALVLVGLRDPVWQAFEHYPRRSPFGRATSQYHDRVETRWGLNAHAAWPFVEPFFNEHERELDVDGRSDVHFFLNCCLGAVVIAAGLAVDSFVSPVLDPPFMSITLALAAFAAAMLAYLGAVRAVRGWGEFKEAAIVLHRFELYDRLGLERPRSVDEERGTVETVNWLLGPTDAGSRSAGAGAIDPSAAQPRDTNGC